MALAASLQIITTLTLLSCSKKQTAGGGILEKSLSCFGLGDTITQLCFQ